MTNDKEPKFDMIFKKGQFTDEQIADLEKQVEALIDMDKKKLERRKNDRT